MQLQNMEAAHDLVIRKSMKSDREFRDIVANINKMTALQSKMIGISSTNQFREIEHISGDFYTQTEIRQKLREWSDLINATQSLMQRVTASDEIITQLKLQISSLTDGYNDSLKKIALMSKEIDQLTTDIDAGKENNNTLAKKYQKLLAKHEQLEANHFRIKESYNNLSINCLDKTRLQPHLLLATRGGLSYLTDAGILKKSFGCYMLTKKGMNDLHTGHYFKTKTIDPTESSIKTVHKKAKVVSIHREYFDLFQTHTRRNGTSIEIENPQLFWSASSILILRVPK